MSVVEASKNDCIEEVGMGEIDVSYCLLNVEI